MGEGEVRSLTKPRRAPDRFFFPQGLMWTKENLEGLLWSPDVELSLGLGIKAQEFKAWLWRLTDLSSKSDSGLGQVTKSVPQFP